MSLNKKVVWLPYDFDTAIGINNSGLLAFSYNLQDIDTQQGGEFIFNGQDSVMWTNLRDAFGPELKSMYQNLRSTGAISYNKVEKMFEDHQEKWSEAIFNEDAYFKYIEPLINPAAGELPDASYLPMAQGSKAEQRKWWLYNRFRYMDSKYNAGDALTDYIMMRAYSVDDITITPYADIYLTTAWDGQLTQVRAHRGQSYVLACPKDSANDAVVAIYSASQLASVGDLSGLKIKSGNFSMATRLQQLKIGDSDSNYSNTNLIDLQLGNNTLLKKLDVRNCPNLAITVNLQGCSNIEEVYFDGTSIAGVVLPNGGVLNTLHLPDSVTNLTVLNQPSLTNFVLNDASYLSTLRLENVGSGVDSVSLLEELEANSRVRLIGVNWEFDTTSELSAIYDILDTMRGLDETGQNMPKAQISGVVNVAYYVGNPATMQARYPNVTITYDELETYSVTFKAFDKTTTLYTATGIVYGTSATYGGETPVREGNYVFKKWNPIPESVTEDMTVYPLFTYLGSTARAIIENSDGDSIVASTKAGTLRQYALSNLNNTNIEEINLPNVTTLAQGAFASTTTIKTINLPNVTTVSGTSVFAASAVERVNLPKATGALQSYALENCSNLVELNAPLITNVSKNTIRACTSLVNISLPSLTSMTGGNAFYGDSILEKAYFPSLTTISGSGHFSNCYKLKYFEMYGGSWSSGSDFTKCGVLVTFIIRKTDAICPLPNTNTFDNTKYATNGAGGAYVYVPRSLITSYQQANNWSTLYTAHSDMFRALEDYTVDGTVMGAFDETKL